MSGCGLIALQASMQRLTTFKPSISPFLIDLKLIALQHTQQLHECPHSPHCDKEEAPETPLVVYPEGHPTHCLCFRKPML